MNWTFSVFYQWAGKWFARGTSFWSAPSDRFPLQLVRKEPETIERVSNMVTKNNKRAEKAAKSRVKIGKLQLKKETLKDLTPGKQKQVKGGAAVYDKTHCGGST